MTREKKGAKFYAGALANGTDSIWGDSWSGTGSSGEGDFEFDCLVCRRKPNPNET